MIISINDRSCILKDAKGRRNTQDKHENYKLLCGQYHVGVFRIVLGSQYLKYTMAVAGSSTKYGDATFLHHYGLV